MAGGGEGEGGNARERSRAAERAAARTEWLFHSAAQDAGHGALHAARLLLRGGNAACCRGCWARHWRLLLAGVPAAGLVAAAADAAAWAARVPDQVRKPPSCL